MAPNIVQSRYQAPGFAKFGIQTVKEIIFGLPAAILKQQAQMAAGFPHIREGDVLGKITASAKFRRYTRCFLNAALVIGNTTAVLKDGTNGNIIEPPFKVGEIITIGTDTNKTIQSVDNVNGSVTFTPGLTANQGLGVTIVLSTLDGSEVAVGVAARPVSSSSFDPTGAAPNTNNYLLDVDYLEDIILSGYLVLSQLRGLDSNAITALVAVNKSPAFDLVYF